MSSINLKRFLFTSSSWVKNSSTSLMELAKFSSASFNSAGLILASIIPHRLSYASTTDGGEIWYSWKSSSLISSSPEPSIVRNQANEDAQQLWHMRSHLLLFSAFQAFPVQRVIKMRLSFAICGTSLSIF